MVALTKALAVTPLARPGTRLLKPSLKQCQLDTPDEIIRFVWTQISARRSRVGNVLDLGAGDGRFAKHGRFDRYIGYEIDAKRIPTFATTDYRILHADALDAVGSFDVVIGNPPYIRNQDLKDGWRRRAVDLLEAEAGVEVDLRANLYVYFMWLALRRSKSDGLIAQVVPADWLVRPSSRHLREYIASKKWSVSSYVFDDAKGLFPRVKTNLTLTLIDKRENSSWSYFGVTNAFSVVPASERQGLVDALKPFPAQQRRIDGLRATRGLSPGAQEVFVLTESQRINSRISKSSVAPCVTSLRALPRSLKSLTEDAFNKHFVDAGRRCWLLKTDSAKLAKPVKRWLKAVPKSVRENGTCGKREPWYSFAAPISPDILYGSGFSKAAPLFIVNQVGAKAVGSVHGILGAKDPASVAMRLRSVDYASSRFQHARQLMKIEVSQMNELLGQLFPSQRPTRR